MLRVIVVSAHAASYSDPVKVNAGARVILGKVDADNPEWRWCIGPDGKEGWIQRSFYTDADETHGVLQAVIVRDYDAMELTVTPGAELEVIETAGGWHYCRAGDGRTGWVPIANVRPR